MFYVEQIKNYSAVHKLTLGHAILLPDFLSMPLKNVLKKPFSPLFKNLFLDYCLFLPAAFFLEKIEHGSRVHKYTLGHDRSRFLALLRFALKSAIFRPDCHTIAFAKFAKIAIFATFQNVTIFRRLIILWSFVLHRTT